MQISDMMNDDECVKALDQMLSIAWNYDTGCIANKTGETLVKWFGPDLGNRFLKLLSAVTALYQNPNTNIATSAEFIALISDGGLWNEIRDMATKGRLIILRPTSVFEDIMLAGIRGLVVYRLTSVAGGSVDVSKQELKSITIDQVPALLAHVADTSKHGAKTLSSKAFDRLCAMLGKSAGVKLARHLAALLSAAVDTNGVAWATALNALLKDEELWGNLCDTCAIKKGNDVNAYDTTLREHLAILCYLRHSGAQADASMVPKP
jgi:hypothetical protein